MSALFGGVPAVAGKIIIAVRGKVATVVAFSRDDSASLGKGQHLVTQRAASGMVRAAQRGNQQPETLLAIGQTFPSILLADSRFRSGIVASWAEMHAKEDRQKAARKEAYIAIAAIKAIRNSGIVF